MHSAPTYISHCHLVRLPGPVLPQSSPPHEVDAYAQLWAISFEAHPATQANQVKMRILQGAKVACS